MIAACTSNHLIQSYIKAGRCINVVEMPDNSSVCTIICEATQIICQGGKASKCWLYSSILQREAWLRCCAIALQAEMLSSGWSGRIRGNALGFRIYGKVCFRQTKGMQHEHPGRFPQRTFDFVLQDSDEPANP